MLLYRNIFLLISFILTFELILCFIVTIRKKTKVLNGLGYIQLTAILSNIYFTVAILLKNVRVVKVFYSLYLITLTLIILAILQLVCLLEDQKDVPKSEQIGRNVFLILVIIASVLLAVFPDYFYNLRPIYQDDKLISWVCKPKKLFIIYAVLTYSFSLKVLVKLIQNSLSSKGQERKIYIVILVSFLLEQWGCLGFFIARQMLFDYSGIICGFFALYSYYYNFYIIPHNFNTVLARANDTVSDAIICFDYKGKCIYINKVGKELYTDENISWINEFVSSTEIEIYSEKEIEINGESHFYSIEFKKLYDEKNFYTGSYIKLNDETAEIAAIEEEKYKASHDGLTGLYNRSYFFKECRRLIDEDPDKPRYMIASNIRNFKLVNDLFGYKFGDDFLKRQAEMFEKANFEGCIKGRLSADRFAMLIPKENFNPIMAKKNTELVREIGNNIHFPLAMQLGLYEIANPNETVQSMYNKAVLAFREDKDSFDIKCKLSVYDSNLMNKVLYEKYVLRDFSKALINDEFQLYLQAQIDSSTEKCLGAEVLVRWCTDNGIKGPDYFISILEKNGLIYQLDFYVWEKAIQLLSKWEQEGNNDLYLSVNISAKDFYYVDIYEVFTQLVEKYHVSPSKLNLELTETILIGEKSPYKKQLQALKDYGFVIEMDDFGSGYSSLNALKNLEMSVLKMDKEFLDHSETEDKQLLIISSIIKMSKALGMKVVAEGVETEKQKNFLKDFGVDIFQGYLYSKPIPIFDFEKKYLTKKAFAVQEAKND